MGKGAGHKVDKKLVMFNTNKGMMHKPMTKAASCPDCGGKMSKGMCKNMCKGMMHKANTRAKVQPGSEGQMRQDWNAFVGVGGAKNKDTTPGKPVANGVSNTERQLNQEAGNWLRHGASGKGFPSGVGAVISERGAGTKDFDYAIGTNTAKPNKGGGKGVGTRKMSKGAGMCKCGSGMSKSMCKCGM